jgi:superfamily II DNA or RNA helicase
MSSPSDNKPEELAFALAETERLRQQIRLLKETLVRHSIPIPELSGKTTPTEIVLPNSSVVAQVPAPSSNSLKVALFQSLFRGREDVYAERIRVKRGDWIYCPAGQKNWEAVLSARPSERKTVDQQTRKLFPLTDLAVQEHLQGKKTLGIYPLLLDETCWFLAADFDKTTWRDDALAFLSTCQRAGVPAYLERSRSGNGGHVWIFFDRPVAAVLARKMGCAILTQTMERRHLGLDSYDRFFPNQDTRPRGGFGNLIAAPLQWVPRQNGNSVFVDDNLEPYLDQWQLLASIQRVPSDRLDWIVNEAARRGQVMGVQLVMDDEEAENEPWIRPPSRKRIERTIPGPFPESVEVVCGNQIYIPKADLPEAMLNRVLRLAAFQNPEFYRAQAMRLPVWDKPRVIACGDDLAHHIALPRGCLKEVTELLKAHGMRISIRDERNAGQAIQAQFMGALRPEQSEAVREILRHDEGVLCAPTAFGKTVVAAKLIAERGVNTLILVHRRQLLEQWCERLLMFLDVPVKSIGRIAAGKATANGCVDVGLLQSLQRKGEVKDLVAHYGQVIVDECHHLSAFSFEQVMRQVKAKYVTGLTATPVRQDGHQPIIFMQCGPIRFRVSARDAIARSPFQHLVLPRLTSFHAPENLRIQDLYSALNSDAERDQQILSDIREAVSEGATPLVLTNRTDHLDKLAAGLCDVEHVLVLKGGMGKKELKAVAGRLASIPEGAPRVILATGSYIGEGFDDCRLDTLFLTMPISWRGTLQQYVGRLHRIHHGKKVVRVYDYVDSHVPMLARMYEKRLLGYRAIGYEVGPSVVEASRNSLDT